MHLQSSSQVFLKQPHTCPELWPQQCWGLPVCHRLTFTPYILLGNQSRVGKSSWKSGPWVCCPHPLLLSSPFPHTPVAHKHKSATHCFCFSPSCGLFTPSQLLFYFFLFIKSQSHLSDWLVPRQQEDEKPLLKLLLPLQLGVCQYHPPTLIWLQESQASLEMRVGEWPREGREEGKGNKNSYQACWASVCRWSLGLWLWNLPGGWVSSWQQLGTASTASNLLRRELRREISPGEQRAPRSLASGALGGVSVKNIIWQQVSAYFSL